MIAGFLLALMFFAVGTTLNLGAAMLPRTREATSLLAYAAALGLTALGLGLPFCLRGPPFFTALVAQGLVIETWRVLEILRTPLAFSRRERAARVLLVPFEHAFLERVPRRWPIRVVAASTLLLACGAAAFVLASRLSEPRTPYAAGGWPRWLGATAAGYLVVEGMTRQWVGVLPAFGWHHRPYQRHPILSRTLAEFWGARWSSVVHRWLRTNVYQPLARRGAARTGVVAAFSASAVMHAYMVWPAAGIVPALWMLAFFLAHGAMMVVEARLGIRRWRRVFGRAFVIAVFVATVPLFMEPVMRAVGL